MRFTNALLLAAANFRIPLNDQVLRFLSPRKDAAPFCSPLTQRAFYICCNVHNGQKRKDGTPFVTHPIATARELLSLGFEDEVIAGALLHDVIEDTIFGEVQLNALIDPSVVQLVLGCTKKKHRSQNDVERAMLENICADWRVGAIKVADRLHNMRTLECYPPPKQRKIALQTEDLYIPIADMLGLWRMRNEMGELCIRYLYPKEFTTIRDYALIHERLHKNGVLEVESGLKEILEECKLEGVVSSRTKSTYSIQTKMKSLGLTDVALVHDICGVRAVITSSSASHVCFDVLARVHSRWCASGQIRDYVTQPKANGYQSLHTVVCLNETAVEIQIRTHDMHIKAEYGVAAHWHYKKPEFKRRIDID